MNIKLLKCLRAVFPVFLFVFLLILFEFVLHVVDYDYNPLRIKVMTQKHKLDWRYYHAFNDEHFVYDSDLIWVPKKKYSVFNANGYTGDVDTIVRNNNKIRIATIGDSNTLGFTAKVNSNWPGYLLKKNSRFELINAAVYGYSSFQGLRRLREVMLYNPDIVFVSFGANDALLVTVSDYVFVSERMMKRVKLDLFLHGFKIGKMLLKFFDILFLNKQNSSMARVSLLEYENNLKKMIEIVHAKKAKVVLLTRPFFYGCPEGKMWKQVAASYNDVVRKVAKEKDVMFVDLFCRFDAEKDLFHDGSHFNDKGHKIAAGIIYNECFKDREFLKDRK